MLGSGRRATAAAGWGVEAAVDPALVAWDGVGLRVLKALWWEGVGETVAERFA